ncbi:MAG: glycosyl hydrolase 53 family protein [Nonlabens sp.]|uniref:glycoside hydrolase family 53 protein n=1 Tax=Nonlabens sp. TaxID=1888209 RepID=UPI00321A01B3
MKKMWSLLLLITLVYSCNPEDSKQEEAFESGTFYKGMDLSFLPENESLGVVFKDENNRVITNNYSYLANRGVNLVRIRLWIDHTDEAYHLDNLKAQALKLKAAGMDYLLDFHYSDTWADPGSQQTPAAWQNLNALELSIAVASYTTDVLRELKVQGTEPAIVQIGNETNNGFLWPVGQIYTGPIENFDNYLLITNAAINAVRTVSPDTKIMIHRAGISDSAYFFDELNSRNIDFDIAGLSYYPWWHGSDITTSENELRSFAAGINQKIMIVETAYPFTIAWNDNLNNIIGLNNQLSSGFPATLEGQHAFMLRIHDLMKNLPNDQGLGYCYWSPDWVAHNRGVDSFMNGSSWENMALFNFDYKATPALEVFELE